MTEQWFLDLDGVRSGPYQTPEIMSLIAEGEVLPHHRIATGLKEQNWKTILDWRLERAKLTQASPVRPAVQAEPAPVEEEIHFTLNEPAAFTPSASFESDEKTQEITARPALHPEKSEPRFDPAFETPLDATAPIPAEIPASPPPVVRRPAEPSSRRDPMAEMFDMLQTTKKKREGRAPLTKDLVGVTVEEDIPAPARKNNALIKTLGIGAGITLIGFALGQLFQQSAPPPEPATSQATPSASPSINPEKGATEIVDRSNPKLTIRAKVEKHMDVAPQSGAPVQQPSISAPAPRSLAKTPVHATPEHNQTEKELEELKNLKKELQELKALKDELRTNPPDTEDESGEASSENADNGNVDSGYNYYPNTNPSESANGQPTPRRH